MMPRFIKVSQPIFPVYEEVTVDFQSVLLNAKSILTIIPPSASVPYTTIRLVGDASGFVVKESVEEIMLLIKKAYET